MPSSTFTRFLRGLRQRMAHAAMSGQGDSEFFLRGLAAAKLLLTTVLMAGLGLCIVGAFALAAKPTRPSPRPSQVAASQAPQAKQKRQPDVVTDALGDPLPLGVLMRIGSSRFRQAAAIAKVIYLGDGKTIASAGETDGIRLWDSATGKLKHHFELPRLPASYLREEEVVTDGSTIFVAQRSKNVVLQRFDATAGKELARSELTPEAANRPLVLAGNGKTVAYASADSFVHLLDTTSGKEKLKFKGGDPPGFLNFVFSPDCGKLAVADNRNAVPIRIHDVADGKIIRELPLGKAVWKFLFSPNGKSLAVSFWRSSGVSAVAVFDLATGKASYKAVEGDIGSSALAFSPDGKVLAIVADKNYREFDVVLWDHSSGKEIQRWQAPGMITAAAFSPDGTSLAAGVTARLNFVGDFGGTIIVWDNATGKMRAASAAPSFPISALRFAEGGKHLVGVAERSYLWDASTGREIRPLPLPTRDGWPCALTSDLSVAARFGPTGKTISLFDPTTGKELRVFEGLDQGMKLASEEARGALPRSLTFSPDGRTLLSVNSKTAQLWNVQTGQERSRLADFPTSPFDPIIFSPDSRYLAAVQVGAKDEIRLCDLTTGKIAKLFSPRYGDSYGLAFSQDGKLIAVAGGNVDFYFGPGPDVVLGTIQIWDVASGKEMLAIEQRERLCFSIAFSPDGRMLATGHDDGSVRLWELATGKERQVFRGHKCVVHALAFSPDGRRLASASDEAPVFIWDCAGAGRE